MSSAKQWCVPGYIWPLHPPIVPIRRSINKVREDVRRIRTPGSFARNSFHVLSGNALAMASQLILTPIIARIYGPEAYGLYALYMALSMNLAAMSDLGYATAYVLPRDEERFLQLVRFNIGLALLLGLLATGLSFMPGVVFSVFPDWKVLGVWLHWVGPASALYALSVFFTQWLTRAKEFKRSAFTGATIDLSMRIFNVGFGWLAKAPSYGLMLGDLLVRALIIPVYLWSLRPHGLGRLFAWRPWAELRSVLIEYKRYPLLVFPERWVSLVGVQLPTFLLASDLSIVGQYGLGASLMLIPLRLLGFSFSTVYLQKAAEIVHHAPEELRRLTHGLYNRLFWVGLGPFLLLTFFADEAFAILFGEAWRNAGVISAFIGGYFFFRLLTDPMASLFNVKRKEHVMLVFGMVMLGVRAAAMLASSAMGYGSEVVILVYALLSWAGQLALSVLLLNTAGIAGIKVTLRSLSLLAVFSFLLALVRFAILGTWLPWFTA